MEIRQMRRRKRARPGRPEGKRTWILVALRAATEPVKEEAMQAIFVECVFGGVQEERVRKMAKRSCRNPVKSLTFEPDSFRDQYRRRGIKYLALIGPSRRIVADHWQISILFWTVARK